MKPQRRTNSSDPFCSQIVFRVLIALDANLTDSKYPPRFSTTGFGKYISGTLCGSPLSQSCRTAIEPDELSGPNLTAHPIATKDEMELLPQWRPLLSICLKSSYISIAFVGAFYLVIGCSAPLFWSVVEQSEPMLCPLHGR